MAVQLALPLEGNSRTATPSYQAWVRSGMSLPYESGLRDRAIAIWLRSLADAMRSKHGREHSG
jgi:hypothetical protein